MERGVIITWPSNYTHLRLKTNTITKTSEQNSSALWSWLQNIAWSWRKGQFLSHIWALETTDALLAQRGMGPTSVVLSRRTAFSYRAATRGAGMSSIKEHNYLQHRESIRGSRTEWEDIWIGGGDGEDERVWGAKTQQLGRCCKCSLTGFVRPGDIYIQIVTFYYYNIHQCLLFITCLS